MTQKEVMQNRQKHYQEVCENLAKNKYTPENATVSILKANILALVIALPFMILFIGLFLILHSEINDIKELFEIFKSSKCLVIIIAMIISIPVHEFLHGLGWHLFCQKSWNSIQFGVMWESITPYCYCSEAVSLGQYYIGLLSPFIVLGIVISIIAICIGSISWLIIGLYNILLAGGDLTIACILLKYIKNKANKKILDHPSECGCVVFLK
ncbi:MAG: DUF3267 domain-containing protein [Oscillospiraceae bacterium]|nr:DUF3267 domain-containing protein [Oscillospiraceae bacterium]